MSLARFERLLKTAMGLDSASIGTSAIERAVQERQRVCRLTDDEAYWQHVNGSGTELQALIEAVVVPETWFFRDREAFALLARVAREEWRPVQPGAMLRLLSLPSSTGEEPYSMAMALLDADFPPDWFRVDAVDISTRALETAKRAIYGNNSFRGGDLTFRSRYFEETASRYRLGDRVRRQVNFAWGNLFAQDARPTPGSYDVIFCRNLLIYFDRSTQESAIHLLDRLLGPKGLLFVAPSETGLLLNYGFASAKVPLAFAFRRGDTAARPAGRSSAPRKPGVRSKPRASSPVALPKSAAPAADVAMAPPVSRPPAPLAARPPDPQVGLDEATRLADQGRFGEAALACEEQLRRCGPSAETFHLLGIVHDASGKRDEAAGCYRKALYLDPNRHDVLIHLALLMDRLDKKEEAEVLRSRARRIAQNGRSA